MYRVPLSWRLSGLLFVFPPCCFELFPELERRRTYLSFEVDLEAQRWNLLCLKLCLFYVDLFRWDLVMAVEGVEESLVDVVRVSHLYEAFPLRLKLL